MAVTLTAATLPQFTTAHGPPTTTPRTVTPPVVGALPTTTGVGLVHHEVETTVDLTVLATRANACTTRDTAATAVAAADHR